MYNKKIILVGLVLLLEGCSSVPKVELNSPTTSSPCRESVAPYSLDSLDRDYSCKRYREGA